MIRNIVFATGLALAPQLAAAQTVVTDPQLLAVAKQTLVVQQQQLAVLNVIAALEASKVTAVTASAALAYATRQGQSQAQAQQAQPQTEAAATPPQQS